MAPKEDPLSDYARPITSDKKKQKWRREHKPGNDAFVDRVLCNEFDAKPIVDWSFSDLNRVMNTNEEFNRTLNLMIENNDVEHLGKIMPAFFIGDFPAGVAHTDWRVAGGGIRRFADAVEIIHYGNDKGWKGAMERFPERTPAADAEMGPGERPAGKTAPEDQGNGALPSRAHGDIGLNMKGQKDADAVRFAMAALGVTMDPAHGMEQPSGAAVRTAGKAKGNTPA